MTESISSSLMLIGISLALRMRDDRSLDRSKLAKLVIVIFLETQFRSYFGILLLGAFIISSYKSNNKSLQASFILGFTLIASALAFPAYRYLETGSFWLPNLGMNKVLTGWHVNPNPTSDTLRKLEDFDFPASFPPSTRVNKGINYNEAAEIALHWRENGLTDLEINRKAVEVGELLASDTKLVFANRALFALTSSGFTLPYCYLNPSAIVFPGYSAKKLCDHIKRTYLFHSWISGSDHLVVFDNFFHLDKSKQTFQIPFQELSSGRIFNDTRKFINNTNVWQRDPTHIGRLAPDWFIMFSLVCLVFASRHQRIFSLMCIFLIIGNFWVNYHAPLGNPRYAYFLFPVYIAFLFLGMSQITSRLRTRTSI